MKENLSKPNDSLAKKDYNYQQSLKKGNGHPIDRFLKINKYFYRPITSPLVRVIFKTSITPNQLTFMAFLVGTAGAALYLTGQPNWFVIGALLIQVSQFFDLADGMLARSKNMSSDFGAYLDLFLDRVTDFFILAGISFGQYRLTGDYRLLIISLFATGLYFLQVCLYYITNYYLGKTKTGETEEARALFMILILVFSILNRLDLLIYIVFIETVINFLVRLAILVRLRMKANLPYITPAAETGAGTVPGTVTTSTDGGWGAGLDS